MKTIEIFSRNENKNALPDIANNVKIRKRTIIIQDSTWLGNVVRIFFDKIERQKFDDFLSRISNLGGNVEGGYFIYFHTDNKWITSKVYEPKTDYIDFDVDTEDLMILENYPIEI